MLEHVRSILLGLTEDGEAQTATSATGYGLSLAQQARAHLTVQAASLKLIVPHTYIGDFGARLVATENRRLHALARIAAETARQNASASGVACVSETPQLPYPDLIRSFTFQARIHDLTVLDAEPVALAVDRGLIEAVLTDSGRPIIVVPPGRNAFKIDRALVAWDGSAKAARALNDALPFLRAASQVDVVSATGEKELTDAVPGAEVAPHLARHGVNVTVTVLPAERGDVADSLRRHAIRFGADLLVMGAYVHSRLRQMVLGGVTQSLLKSCPVPLLLSH